MISFIRYIATQAWRYGVDAVNAAIRYVRNNWSRVRRMAESVGWAETLRWILEFLGYI